jgi:hypothetical protein
MLRLRQLTVFANDVMEGCMMMLGNDEKETVVTRRDSDKELLGNDLQHVTKELTELLSSLPKPSVYERFAQGVGSAFAKGFYLLALPFACVLRGAFDGIQDAWDEAQ